MEKIFEVAKIDCKRRGETLSMSEFAALADAVVNEIIIKIHIIKYLKHIMYGKIYAEVTGA